MKAQHVTGVKFSQTQFKYTEQFYLSYFTNSFLPLLRPPLPLPSVFRPLQSRSFPKGPKPPLSPLTPPAAAASLGGSSPKPISPLPLSAVRACLFPTGAKPLSPYEPNSNVNMSRVRGILFQTFRKLHSLSRDGPSESLRKRIAELEKKRKRKDPRKNQIFVEVPDSKSFLDTATLPMILTVAGTALFAKLLMMLDESRSQETIERKIKNAPPGQGTVRMLSREEWEEIREVRPRTPFESKLARPNARIRTGEPLHWEDVKDWTIDVLTDGFTRVEESVRRGSN